MISVIIPTLNEEKVLEKTLASVKKELGENEIIVVDGGSKDNTLEIAKSGANVFLSRKRGRSSQMNLGAKSAKGDLLFFLHADTTLPKGAFKEIKRILSDKKIIAGGFRRKFINSKGILNTNFFHDKLYDSFGVIWGDQGFFIRKKDFEMIGGFPNIEIMEDYAISKKLKKLGNLEFSKKRVMTSERRITDNYFKAYITYVLVFLLYRFGVSPKKIKQIYKEVR